MSLIDEISKFVVLQRRGQKYVGLCPFHVEKTPSFTVDEEKSIFHCFGCGIGGNAANFKEMIQKRSEEILHSLDSQRTGALDKRT